MKKCYVDGCAVYATITLRNARIERRVYSTDGKLPDDYKSRFVQINKTMFTLSELLRAGDKVSVWF